jgi:hypothetical protein
MMHGFPLSAKLPDDLGLGERFWYWRGSSGQSYIHSIYTKESCPPLPGAVFVTVHHRDGKRIPVAVGRFPAAMEDCSSKLAEHTLSGHRADEIHVHLLARDKDAAYLVLADLQQALEDDVEISLEKGSGAVLSAQFVLIAA